MKIKETHGETELLVDITSDRLIIDRKFLEDDGFEWSRSKFSLPMREFIEFIRQISLGELKDSQ